MQFIYLCSFTKRTADKICSFSFPLMIFLVTNHYHYWMFFCSKITFRSTDRNFYQNLKDLLKVYRVDQIFLELKRFDCIFKKILNKLKKYISEKIEFS